MSILTVWTNSSAAVQRCQLSDDPADGTAQEQIAHLATLSFLAGWSCVDPDFTGSVPDGDAAQWRWSDGQIVSVPVVPASVTPRQVRLLLLQQGLLANVESLIASSDQATKITWEFASEFKRNDPLLLALAQQLGLTSEQIDAFFIAAANI
jgi:hypothetical protein